MNPSSHQLHSQSAYAYSSPRTRVDAEIVGTSVDVFVQQGVARDITHPVGGWTGLRRSIRAAIVGGALGFLALLLSLVAEGVRTPRDDSASERRRYCVQCQNEWSANATAVPECLYERETKYHQPYGSSGAAAASMIGSAVAGAALVPTLLAGSCCFCGCAGASRAGAGILLTTTWALSLAGIFILFIGGKNYAENSCAFDADVNFTGNGFLPIGGALSFAGSLVAAVYGVVAERTRQCEASGVRSDKATITASVYA